MSVDALRSEVRFLAKTAEEQAYALMVASAPSAAELRDVIPDMVRVYADTAALMAADWYAALNSESRYLPVMDDDLAEAKIANIADWVHAGPQKPESRIRVAANRMVFDAARRTVFVNAVREGVGVARDEEPLCCNKCIARATVAVKNPGESHDDVDQVFHPSCEGMFVPVRSQPYEPPNYARQWSERLNSARLAGNASPDDIASWLDKH